MVDTLDKYFKKVIRQEKVSAFKRQIRVFLFALLLILPPVALYLFMKWDPIIYRDGQGIPLSACVLSIIYWVVFYQIYKYKKRSRDRTWQLANFLSEKFTAEERERERIRLASNFLFMNKLKNEHPEFFEEGFLKIPDGNK